MKMTIAEASVYYGKRYTKILKALEEIGVKEVNVDTECHGYLELSCRPFGDDEILWMNIGLNNKYNTSYGSTHSWQYKPVKHSYDSQGELAYFIKVVGGKISLWGESSWKQSKFATCSYQNR